MDNWTIAIIFLVTVYLEQVYSAQEFERQPESVRAVRGETRILRCVVKNRVGIVQWTRAGFGLGYERELPGYERYSMIGSSIQGNIEEYSLKIENIQLEDDANYTCQVMPSDNEEALVSKAASVTVLIPPNRPLLPINSGQVSLILNQPMNITCRAESGKPKSDITWRKDDIRITDHVYKIVTQQPDSKLVDTTGKVTITAQLEDAGKKIECGAKNEALEDQYWVQATLNVQYAPIKVSMTHSNPDKTMKEYDDVTFECTGEANPYEITWKWYKDGQLIPDQNSNIYRINKISRQYHGSKIKCEATNEIGSTTFELPLNILYGPKFKDEERHVSVDLNSRAELKCEADGNPTAEITWTRDGSNRVLHSSSTYVIPSVREAMFGIYTCTATVIGFYEISRKIYVMENGPPSLASEPTQFAKLGELAEVECKAIASPKPQFVWSRNGRLIDFTNTERFSADNYKDDIVYGLINVMRIINVQEEDYGVYNCTANNGRGSDTQMIKLEKTEELPIAIIIGGAVGGVGVIFIIIIACLVYHKCRHSDNESYAETDSNTEIRKRDKNDSPSEMTKSTLMDQWRQDYNYRYSADFDDVDSKPGNGSVAYTPNGYDTERYGTLPTNYPNGPVYRDPSIDDLGPLNRYENSYSTGYIPSTFRSPSRTDYASGRVSVNELASGRVSVNDYTNGRVSATDFTRPEPLEPFRLPPADYSTTKLATNV